jgi:hypothetical protein
MRMSQNARGVESEVNESVVVSWGKGELVLTAQDLHPEPQREAAERAPLVGEVEDHPSVLQYIILGHLVSWFRLVSACSATGTDS